VPPLYQAEHLARIEAKTEEVQVELRKRGLVR
jgi:hypothetical protein